MGYNYVSHYKTVDFISLNESEIRLPLMNRFDPIEKTIKRIYYSIINILEYLRVYTSKLGINNLQIRKHKIKFPSISKSFIFFINIFFIFKLLIIKKSARIKDIMENIYLFARRIQSEFIALFHNVNIKDVTTINTLWVNVQWYTISN